MISARSVFFFKVLTINLFCKFACCPLESDHLATRCCILGVGIKLWFFGRLPKYQVRPVQIWFQHLTIDQCKVWCMLNHGYTTSPVTGPSVARFHVNGGHPQPHTPRFSDIEGVYYLDVCYFINSYVINVAYVRIDIRIHRLLEALLHKKSRRGITKSLNIITDCDELIQNPQYFKRHDIRCLTKRGFTYSLTANAIMKGTKMHNLHF